MTTANRSVRPAILEIDRDDRITTCSLLRNLAYILVDVLDTLLLGDRLADALQLQDRVEGALAASRATYRALNDARIVRRGTRRELPDDPAIPEAARPFRRNGAYRGSFDSLQALAADYLGVGTTGHRQLHRLDLTGVGLDLHTEGVVWTIDIDGRVHAFRPYPSGTPDEPSSPK